MKKLSLFLASALLLSACGGSKSSVRSDGTTDEPRFPAPYSVTFDNNRGTFPTADELANVKSGVTKDQLYKLLGRPHYDEGMFGVREWDYLFHFHTPGQGSDNVTTCQFKIIFDSNKIARSFFWNAVDPVHAVCPPFQPSPKNAPEVKRITLSADALFAFDKSGVNDMRPEGRQELQTLASRVRQFDQLRAIRITGHTDRLGDEQYNQRLSERRAETVRQYLIQMGLPAGIMSARGLGESQPLGDCQSGNRQQLIACLQPNRRVEIEVDGSGLL